MKTQLIARACLRLPVLLACLACGLPGRAQDQVPPAPPAIQEPAQPSAPAAAQPAQPTFDERAQAAILRVGALAPTLNKELLEGRWDDYLSALRAATPDHEHDAVQALAFGEALWPIDPSLAAAAFEQAFQREPQERSVLYARGRILHLQKKHAEALAAYAKAAELAHPASNVLHGLMADCHLALGDLPKATQAWNRTGAMQALGNLERDLRAIHGHEALELRRQKLLAKIKAGDTSLFEELIALDCFWQGKKMPRQYERVYCQADGDQVNSQRTYLKHDLELARTTLGKDERRYVELEYFASSRMKVEPNAVLDQRADPDEPMGNGFALPPSSIERSGKKLGFVGSRKFKKYPHSSRTAPFIYRVLFMDGVTISVEWIDLFGDEILARATSERGDVHAAAFLLDLYAEAIFRKFPTWETLPEKRALREKEFWERYKDVRIAWRILDRQAAEIAHDDPFLLEAARLFPADARIASLACDAARRAQQPQKERLVAQARACLAEGDAQGASNALIALQRELAK